LNHAEPAVVDYVAEVMIHWLDRGADGWRLDAAYAVPLTFWAEVSRRVRERHPDAYLLGEVIHGDYPAFVGEGGLDAVTQYELWQAIRNAIAERNLYELAWTLGRHAEFLDRFVPQTFLGNHDVTRIASAVTAEHLPHALAVLCCTGGTPSVYAGDELGWEAVKEERFGGDDAIRPAFPPAGELRLDGHQRAVLDLHRMLIGVRRRHPWLHTARTTVPELDNTHAVLHSVPDPRTDPEADGVWLDLALNLGDERPNLAVPGSGQLLAGRGELIDPGTDRARVVLPAHGWAVLGPA
jgi:cyclomaltodextrinase